MRKTGSFFGNIIMAIGIGGFAGIGSIFFNIAIDGGVVLLNQLLLKSTLYYVLLPIMGGLLTLGLHHLFLKNDHSGVGIVQILVELDHIKTHFMKPFRVFIRVVAATITLIFGFSAGRFGPIVHLGASVGSNVGYRLKLSPETIRILIGCGAAAAISAVFRMPLFSAVFTLEVLYRKQFSDYFAPVVISAVVANQLGILIQGEPVVWHVDAFVIQDGFRLILLGLSTGGVGILYIYLINTFTEWFSKRNSRVINYLVGAVGIGLVAFLFPLNMELHAQTTIRVLMGEFSIALLIAIAMVKLFTTALTLGTGYIGGNFYPVVTIGAALGRIFGSSSAFSVLGMGGLISSYLNAPISGIIWILEFSGQFQMLIPALIVCALSVSTTHHFLNQDIFTVPFKLFNKEHEAVR
ncbi:chloride channel protein [Fusibacter tunisiensis]|uniref:CIC family chloride channel protein n=1 Tax=Fusibacter tunisiensis TaxID=1008308 RepID=A0ABS2MQP5_9FIRM|nr:chloride channel protein [Fusibacter tunisiensis]MBM7561715.1 CIC family chloride channel protein [Fusibacter tunisiensis]